MLMNIKFIVNHCRNLADSRSYWNKMTLFSQPLDVSWLLNLSNLVQRGRHTTILSPSVVSVIYTDPPITWSAIILFLVVIEIHFQHQNKG